MAKGRTVAATELTEVDRKAIRICDAISKKLYASIPDPESKREFLRIFGKVHESRDAGLGVAGGKLQRDTLCTRGRTDKAPFSNRNLRWHPLILAYETPHYAKTIDDILIKDRKLIFIIDGKQYAPENVYTLPNVYCAPLYKWKKLVEELKQWNHDDWTRNSCFIPAAEYAPVNHSLETFAILGMAVVSTFYGANLLAIYEEIFEILRSGLEEIGFPISNDFPGKIDVEKIVKCPLCLAPINNPPAGKIFENRPPIWQPIWRKSKREEGRAESLQLFHAKPLTEREIRHTARYVRYGHRLCNVAMADHSVDEIVDFMKRVVEAHRKENKNL